MFEHRADYESQWAAMNSIATKIGCTKETLRKWVRQSEKGQGIREGLTTDKRERLKVSERENPEIKSANASFTKAKMRGADLKKTKKKGAKGL